MQRVQTTPTNLQRPGKKPLVNAIALSLSLSIASAQAATIEVLNNSDVTGNCSFRDAVQSANTNTSVGNCVGGNGADLIDLSAIAGQTVTLSGDSVQITSAVTISGHGTTISGNNANRVFEVTNSSNATINDLTITAGQYANGGGALFVGPGATLSLNKSTVSSSSAGVGGAVMVEGSNTKAAILNANQSYFSGNTADLRGGAIFARNNATITLTNSTLANNSSDYGGGVNMLSNSYDGILSSTLNVTNSTFSSNTATFQGGAIHNLSSEVSLKASTLSGNVAGEEHGGGGVFFGSDGDGTLTLSNSIIANSTHSDCAGGASVYGGYIANYISGSGVNLVMDGAVCGLTASASLLTDDPMLDPLGSNGGPTNTQALQAGSPAIDAAISCAGVVTDQRGLSRIDGSCDLGAFELGGYPVQPGPDFEVNSIGDLPTAGIDGFCSPLPEDCTLREAIDASNVHPAASTITFANDLVSPAPATLTLTNGQLPVIITSTLTIEGSGITISGDSTSGILKTSYAALTLNHLNLKNGSADMGGGLSAVLSTININDSTISGNTADRFGGGIFVEYCQVRIRNTTISGNSASGNYAVGGGVHADSTVLDLNNSTVSGNSAVSHGGGIYADAGSLGIFESKIIDNTASNASGGGIFAKGSGFLLRFSTVSGNSANSGGGVYGYNIASSSGSNFIESSTISNNTAVSAGGGVDINHNYYLYTPLRVVNSTLSGNSAGIVGGGIKSYVTSISILDSTLMDNAATVGGGVFHESGIINIENSIIAGSTGGDCAANSSTLSAVGVNLIGDSTGCTFSGGTILSGDPVLGPLIDNGGPTLTHLPLDGSRVIDAGSPANPSRGINDQRSAGFPRVMFGGVDIGAVELQTRPEIIFMDSFEEP